MWNATFRKLLLVYCFLCLVACHHVNSQTNTNEQVSNEPYLQLATWNLKDFGKSKKDEQLEFMAKTMAQFDLVAVQEIVPSFYGAQKLAKLVDYLNRTGCKWDYALSNPTQSSPSSSERYAFLWKPSKITVIGKPLLDTAFTQEFEREPFIATFKCNKMVFSIANLHAIPKSKEPEKELKYLQFLPDKYANTPMIICGDMNCSQSNQVFNPLIAKGFKAVLQQQKTSLRQKCINDDCLASEYDNFFVPSGIKILQSGVIHFYTAFDNMKEAAHISDHIPVFTQIVPIP